MSPDKIDAKEEIFKFLTETNTIYNHCKKYSILIEELLPSHKAPIHAANELKSLVFHLYNAAQSKSINDNIVEAKEHLCRAFYDLHSLLVSIYIEQIKNKLSAYKDATIANIFPEYGNTIRPIIKDLQVNLQKLRSNRNTDIDMINENIDQFQEQISTLAKFDDVVESMKPAMNAYEEKSYWQVVLRVLITIVVGLVFLGIGYYLAGLKNN